MALSDVTRAKMKLFVKALRQDGIIGHACEASGMNRQTYHYWIKRSSKFKKACEEAVQIAVDRLEQEAVRRAVVGVDDPIYQRGELVGHRKVYSDGLMQFLLKGNRPEKFRDKADFSVELRTKTGEQDLDSAIEALMARVATVGEGGAEMEVAGEAEPDSSDEGTA